MLLYRPFPNRPTNLGDANQPPPHHHHHPHHHDHHRSPSWSSGGMGEPVFRVELEEDLVQRVGTRLVIRHSSKSSFNFAKKKQQNLFSSFTHFPSQIDTDSRGRSWPGWEGWSSSSSTLNSAESSTYSPCSHTFGCSVLWAPSISQSRSSVQSCLSIM